MELVAPVQILGVEKKSGGYTKTNPKSWSAAEIEWMLARKSEGFSVADIAHALQRSDVSVQTKLKRLTKTDDSYNARFRELKYRANDLYLDALRPESVLDVYAGDSWWAKNVSNVATNDLNDLLDTDYHLDAFDLLCDLYRAAEEFDVIDLDPFGSAYECFDFAVRLAKKGVVVSFGEWGHKRWKRTDFVSSRYGIDSVEDYDADKFIAEFQRIARTHKKRAVVFDSLQYGNFLRVYFVLEGFKETSQWLKK
jgi:hypothetical protein